MLILVGTGLVATGAVLLSRKLYVSIQSVLRLSEDLNPLRLPNASQSESPAGSRPEMVNDSAAKSMLRLSAAVSRSKDATIGSAAVPVGPKIPVA